MRFGDLRHYCVSVKLSGVVCSMILVCMEQFSAAADT